MIEPIAEAAEYTPLTAEQKVRLDRLQLRPSWGYRAVTRQWTCHLMGVDGRDVAVRHGPTDAEALDRALDAAGA